VKMESFEEMFKRVDNKNKNYELIEGMTEEEKELSFLNVAFTFVKKKNSTPAIYKKLVKMIDNAEAKEAKKVEKEVSDVVEDVEDVSGDVEKEVSEDIDEAVKEAVKEVTVPEGDVKIVGEEKQEIIEEIEEDLAMINEVKKEKGVKVKKAMGKAKGKVKIKISKKGKEKNADEKGKK
jgi:hypothetical protein